MPFGNVLQSTKGQEFRPRSQSGSSVRTGRVVYKYASNCNSYSIINCPYVCYIIKREINVSVKVMQRVFVQCYAN